MPKRRGWGWSNKHGFLMLEVNGVPVRVYGNYGDDKKTSSTDWLGIPFGTPMQLPDGRVFRYCLNGADTVGAGMLCQNPLKTAADDMDLQVQTAGAIGDATLAITTAGAVTADRYKDGYMYMNDGTGEGHLYRIKSHTVVTGAATMTVTFADGETIAEATSTSTSSLCGLKRNPYNGVLLYNTTEDGLPRGVAPRELTAAYYGWLQTWGDAAVWIYSTVVVGKAVSPSLTTSGAVDSYPITLSGDASPYTYADGDVPVIGWVADPIAATTDYGHIFLTIAP